MEATPFESIFAYLPCGLCVVDGEGKILNINPALEGLVGWHATESFGQPLAFFLEQTIVDSAQALCWTIALSQALAQAEIAHLNVPTEFQTRSEGAPSVSLTGIAAPWMGKAPGQSGALFLFFDRSSQKDLEGMRGRFLAVLAHELGTPVSHLTVAAEHLDRHLQAGEVELSRLLQVIQTETRVLRRLLAQFPTLLPAAPAIPQARRQLVPLRPCLRQVDQAFRLRDLNCEIVVRVPPDLPFAWSDAERIQQVLSKLVDNAIRYAPPASEIVLAAEERGDELVVSVQDRGPGIPAGDAEAIFEPWRRGSEEEPDQEHQGLGLAMAQALVHSLDGKVWHESPAEGGVRFCFSLPRAKGAPDQEGE